METIAANRNKISKLLSAYPDELALRAALAARLEVNPDDSESSLRQRYMAGLNRTDLKELREREALIQRDSFDGIDYDAGSISAIKLIEQTLSLKVGLCETTIENYQNVFKILQGYDIFYHPVKSIKKSDAKNWIIQLYRDGKKSSTIGRLSLIHI